MPTDDFANIYDVIGPVAAKMHQRILAHPVCAKWIERGGLSASKDGSPRLPHFVIEAREWRTHEDCGRRATLSLHWQQPSCSKPGFKKAADWISALEDDLVQVGHWRDDNLRWLADALGVPYVMLAALNMVDTTGVWDLPYALMQLQLEYLREEEEQ